IVDVFIVATRPSEYSVTRSVAIAAPPDAVFPHVNELKKWAVWNPWEKIDPAMKLTYEGPASGVGASYAWVGNSKAGEGRMTISWSRSAEVVRRKLGFFKPMAGVINARFNLQPEGRHT